MAHYHPCPETPEARIWKLLERYVWLKQRRADTLTTEETAFVEAAMRDAPDETGTNVEEIRTMLANRPRLIRSVGGAALAAAFVGANTDAVVALLVAEGARFEHDPQWWSPLHQAADEICRQERPTIDRFRTVFEHGLAAATAIAVKPPYRGISGNRSLLHIVGFFGHPKLAELLLKHGAAAVAERPLGRDGPTALQLATRMHHWRERREQTAQMLLAGGAYYDVFSACARNDGERLAELLRADSDAAQQRNGQEETPLHWAAWCGARECAEQLLKAGARVNAAANNGKTPLHLAAGPLNVPPGQPRPDNIEVVRLLLGNGAAVDASDDHARSPLHHAAYQGYSEAAEALLAAGANTRLRNVRGKTPLEVARRGAAHLRRRKRRGGR